VVCGVPGVGSLGAGGPEAASPAGGAPARLKGEVVAGLPLGRLGAEADGALAGVAARLEELRLPPVP